MHLCRLGRLEQADTELRPQPHTCPRRYAVPPFKARKNLSRVIDIHHFNVHFSWRNSVGTSVKLHIFPRQNQLKLILNQGPNGLGGSGGSCGGSSGGVEAHACGAGSEAGGQANGETVTCFLLKDPSKISICYLVKPNIAMVRMTGLYEDR